MRKIVGTTAFTSVGRFDTTLTTPLAPRSCTMSLGRVEYRPRIVDAAGSGVHVWRNPLDTGPSPPGARGESFGNPAAGLRVEPRLSAWFTVTYDHRITDGALVARFGDRLRRRLKTLS